MTKPTFAAAAARRLELAGAARMSLYASALDGATAEVLADGAINVRSDPERSPSFTLAIPPGSDLAVLDGDSVLVRTGKDRMVRLPIVPSADEQALANRVRALHSQACHGAGPSPRWEARRRLALLAKGHDLTVAELLDQHHLSIDAYFSSRPIGDPPED